MWTGPAMWLEYIICILCTSYAERERADNSGGLRCLQYSARDRFYITTLIYHLSSSALESIDRGIADHRKIVIRSANPRPSLRRCCCPNCRRRGTWAYAWARAATRLAKISRKPDSSIYTIRWGRTILAPALLPLLYPIYGSSTIQFQVSVVMVYKSQM